MLRSGGKRFSTTAITIGLSLCSSLVSANPEKILSKVAYVHPAELTTVSHLNFGVIRTTFGNDANHWVTISPEGKRTTDDNDLLVPSDVEAAVVTTSLTAGVAMGVSVVEVGSSKGYYTLKDIMCKYNAQEPRPCQDQEMLIVGEDVENDTALFYIGGTIQSNGVGAEVGQDDTWFTIQLAYQ